MLARFIPYVSRAARRRVPVVLLGSLATLAAAGPAAVPLMGQVSALRSFRGQLNGTYTMQQASGNRFVDAHESASQDYRLVTRPPQNDDSQRWVLRPLGRDLYTIQQLSTRRFVDAHENTSQDYRLVTRPGQNNDSQRWQLRSLGNDRYTIQQVSTGRFVDAHETAGQDYRLVTRPTQNNDTQRWIIKPVASNQRR